MLQLLPIFMAMPFIGFWIWMFLDMTNNPYLDHNARNNWAAAFLVANIFTAFYYYTVEYKPRHK